MKIAVIIPAAGSGQRMGGVKKQFLNLNGVPVLAHTIRQFERFKQIDSIFVVLPKGDEIRFRSEILDPFRFEKIHHMVEGGSDRQESVLNGIKSATGYDLLMVHDGVRPFITKEIIASSIQSAIEFGAAITAVSEIDSVKKVSADNFVTETLNRDLIFRVQTPQTFKREVLEKAFQKAEENGFRGTDESSIVENSGFNVKVIPGSYNNIKITTKEDLDLCPAIMERLSLKGWEPV